MKITFLGTGTSQGIPVIGCDCPVCLSKDPRDQRLRTSAYIEYASKKFIIDVGPDFRQQMLQNGLDDADAVLITHEHNDHVIGMDDVRPINFKYRKSIPVLGLKRTLNEIEKRFPYVFSENAYPGAPRIHMSPIPADRPFKFERVTITPIQVMHGTLPILGYAFGQEIAYLTDVKHLPDDEIQKLKGISVLVINALHRYPHHSHLNLEQALALIDQLNPGKTYLTHLSHQMGLHADVESQLPPTVFLAYDGLKITN